MSEHDYLPYKAINVLIEREYLEKVLGMILKNKDKLPKEELIILNNLFKQYVNVLGFRNPVRAPLPLQIKAYASAFEQKDEVIPSSLSAWAKINLDFAEQVKSWLETEGWNDLALERRYTEGEGFINDWPEKFSFDQLEKKFKKANPSTDYNRDDLILMVIWISGRLPKEQTDI
jgi:hypothetical protein